MSLLKLDRLSSSPQMIPPSPSIGPTMSDDASPWILDHQDHDFSGGIGDTSYDLDLSMSPGLISFPESFGTGDSPHEYPFYTSNPRGDSLLLGPADNLGYPSNLFHTPYNQLNGQGSRGQPSIRIETDVQPSPYSLEIPYTYDQRTSPQFSPRSSLVTTTPSTPIIPITPDQSQASLNPMLSPYINNSPSSPMTPPSHSPSYGAFYNIHTQSVMQTVLTVPQLATRCTNATDGPLVPQKTYRPHTQSDRRRYVEDIKLEEPIMFYVNNPSGCGIPLRDAINSRFSRLVGRDDAMFEQRGPSISIRLMWPGYAPWSRQIPTRDFRSPPQPITRSKLAKNVAKTMLRFITEMNDRPQEEEDTNVRRWKVSSNRQSNNHITFDDLVLVGLQHVSMGSWQAHVRVRARNQSAP